MYISTHGLKNHLFNLKDYSQSSSSRIDTIPHHPGGHKKEDLLLHKNPPHDLICHELNQNLIGHTPDRRNTKPERAAHLLIC